jgi:hypothetical protein
MTWRVFIHGLDGQIAFLEINYKRVLPGHLVMSTHLYQEVHRERFHHCCLLKFQDACELAPSVSWHRVWGALVTPGPKGRNCCMASVLTYKAAVLAIKIDYRTGMRPRCQG